MKLAGLEALIRTQGTTDQLGLIRLIVDAAIGGQDE